MSTQLQEELERSFGDGPEQRPVGTHLEAGRRALRRRRVATGALGMVLVAGTGLALAGPGSSPRTTGELAPDPTPSTSFSPSQEIGWDLGPVRYRDGVLEVHPDAVVHERIDNPYRYVAPQASAAFDLTFEGQRTWVIAELKGGDPQYSSRVPSSLWASFADWVAAQAGLAVPGNDGWPVTLVLDDRGAVVAAGGAEVLQRTDDRERGPTFAGPGDPTGAAVVRTTDDGQSYFVVWRVVDGELDVITAPPADVVGATFQELLTYARGKYASGEGLR